MTTKVADFTVYDYGIERASDILGDCIIGWERLEIGIGDNPVEALNNALESITQGDEDNIDLEDLESRIKRAFPAFTRKAEDLPSANQYVLDQWKEDNPYKDLDEAEEAIQEHEFHYYIGVGWSLPPTSEDEVKL